VSVILLLHSRKRYIVDGRHEVSVLVKTQIYRINGVWKKLKIKIFFLLCYLFG
jgi:hypothetical protein